MAKVINLDTVLFVSEYSETYIIPLRLSESLSLE